MSINYTKTNIMNSIYKISFYLFIIFSLYACKDEEKNEKIEKNKDVHEEEVLLTNQQMDAMQMKLGKIENRTVSGFITTNGSLIVPPQNLASVSSVINANIKSIRVVQGDKVKKGQVLAYLHHPDIINIQSNYLNAYSNSSFLQKNFQRQKKLYDAGVGSGVNYQKAKAEYQASKAITIGLEAQLKMLHINPINVKNGNIQQQIALRSPINGFVQKVDIKTGQFATPETKLFEIIDPNSVHADFMVFEKDAHLVKKGQKIEFTLESIPNKVITSTIESLSKSLEQNPKAIHIHAEIDNKNEKLIPGMYLKGKILINSKKSPALPESAIVKEGDKFIAFTVEKEGDKWAFKPVEINIGQKHENWIAVKFLNKKNQNKTFALNNAYYLIAEMKKSEAEHSH